MDAILELWRMLRPLLTARLAQHVVKLMAIVFAAQGGIDAGRAKSSADCIAEFTVAGLCYLADLALHRWRKTTKRSGGPPGPLSPPPAASTGSRGPENRT